LLGPAATAIAQNFPVRAGETYYFEFWYKFDAGATGSARLGGVTLDAAGSAVGFPLYGVTPTTTWTKLSASFTVESNSVSFTLVAFHDYAPSTGNLYIDDVLLVKKVPTEGIADGAVTAAKITNQTITAAQIANNTIAAGNLVNNTITANQISNATITATQISNATITGVKLANQSIASVNIANNTITANNIANATIGTTQISSTAGITGGQIANNTITANNINNATITANKIASATITATQIASLTITASQIANLTITGAQIANATITSAKIADLSVDKITGWGGASISILSNLTLTGAANLILQDGGIIIMSGYPISAPTSQIVGYSVESIHPFLLNGVSGATGTFKDLANNTVHVIGGIITSLT
jgi:hypothetical protein